MIVPFFDKTHTAVAHVRAKEEGTPSPACGAMAIVNGLLMYMF